MFYISGIYTLFALPRAFKMPSVRNKLSVLTMYVLRFHWNELKSRGPESQSLKQAFAPVEIRVENPGRY